MIEGFVPGLSYQDCRTLVTGDVNREPDTRAGYSKIYSYGMKSGGELLNCCGVYGFAGIYHLSMADLLGMCKFAKRARFGMAVCTTATGQRVAEEVLREFGFRCLFETYNPNSGNDIRLWAFDLANWEPSIEQLAKK